MSLTVKAFLDVEGKENGEIRRFQIPADMSTSYAYLVQKIAGIFPGLKEDSFSLYWKDSDDDYILFYTDEEQMDALGFVYTNSVFKVYIRKKEPKAESSTKSETDEKEELHQGMWEMCSHRAPPMHPGHPRPGENMGAMCGMNNMPMQQPMYEMHQMQQMMANMRVAQPGSIGGQMSGARMMPNVTPGCQGWHGQPTDQIWSNIRWQLQELLNLTHSKYVVK